MLNKKLAKLLLIYDLSLNNPNSSFRITVTQLTAAISIGAITTLYCSTVHSKQYAGIAVGRLPWQKQYRADGVIVCLMSFYAMSKSMSTDVGETPGGKRDSDLVPWILTKAWRIAVNPDQDQTFVEMV